MIPLKKNIILIVTIFLLLSLNFSNADTQPNSFKKANPNYQLKFPRDHGEHKNFKLEWWYLTANLTSETFGDLGIQWTLFKNELRPDKKEKSWKLDAFWMAHSAITTKNNHYFEERFARMGVGTAGVSLSPFKAWIDNWSLKGKNNTLETLTLISSGENFSYHLELQTQKRPILQGNNGFSLKSESGNSSHYYSQPFYQVTGWIEIEGQKERVKGFGWLDREWSSDLLGKNQLGWDWFSIHLKNGDKIMLYQVRSKNESHFISGSWINKFGVIKELSSEIVKIKFREIKKIQGIKIPVSWQIFFPEKSFNFTITPINENSFMETIVPYWEGPVKVQGSFEGFGYLEMTGYSK